LQEKEASYGRSRRSLTGASEVTAERLRDGPFKLTARITNTTPWSGEDRESALPQTFVSAHTILTVENEEFVSLTDPPEALQVVAAGCENIKTWPVLAGKRELRVLCSPR
jgi:hypothetical protein